MPRIEKSPGISFRDIHSLAEAANAAQEPDIASLIRAYGYSNDPALAVDLVDVLQPRAVEQLLAAIPFRDPTIEELEPHLCPRKPITLGTLINRDLLFQVSADSLARNFTLSGHPGTGKTNFLYGLSLQAKQYCNVCWVDRNKRDYRHLTQLAPDILVFDAQKNFPFNPLQVPPGIDPRHHLTWFVETFCKCNSLLDGSEGLLFEVCHELFAERQIFEGSEHFPTLRELRLKLHSCKFKGYDRRARYRESCLGRLDNFLVTNPGMYDFVKGFSIPEIASKNFVLELRLGERQSRTILSWLAGSVVNYNLTQNNRGGIRNLFVVDECRYLVPPAFNNQTGYSPLANILAECREAGVGFTFADQGAFLDEAVFRNSSSKLTFALGSGVDMRAIQQHYHLDEPQTAFISKLAVGEAILKVERLDPILIRTPKVRLG